jgi:hypothetical protein
VPGAPGALARLRRAAGGTGDGDRESARRGWQRALAIFAELDHPDTEQVRGKLVKLEMSSTGPAS